MLITHCNLKQSIEPQIIKRTDVPDEYIRLVLCSVCKEVLIAEVLEPDELDVTVPVMPTDHKFRGKTWQELWANGLPASTVKSVKTVRAIVVEDND